jgi:hypothetical protein
MRKFFGERRDHLARRRGGECRPQEGCHTNQEAPSVQSPSSNGRTARANCQRGRSSTLPTLRQIRPTPDSSSVLWAPCTRAQWGEPT